MELNTILLTLAALVPACVLCIYVFKKDRVEKEPIWLLLFLLLCGMASCTPAAWFETIIIDGIDFAFAHHVIAMGKSEISGMSFYLYNFVKFFFGVALIEEGLKWLFLRVATFKNKNFNCLFDGMIYAIFVSLGFAALENVMYVTEYGWINAFTRGVLSVPGHMFFAVMMGYHYSKWNILSKAKAEEQRLKAKGIISQDAKEFNSSREGILSIAMPVLLHGIYNFCCTMGGTIFTYIFVAFILFLYYYCFKKIKKFSKADNYNGTYTKYLILRKYPDLDILEG